MSSANNRWVMSIAKHNNINTSSSSRQCSPHDCSRSEEILFGCSAAACRPERTSERIRQLVPRAVAYHVVPGQPLPPPPGAAGSRTRSAARTCCRTRATLRRVVDRDCPAQGTAALRRKREAWPRLLASSPIADGCCAHQGRLEEDEEAYMWGLRFSEWWEREATWVFWDIREYTGLQSRARGPGVLDYVEDGMIS